MKRVIIILLCFTVSISCKKNETKTEVQDDSALVDQDAKQDPYAKTAKQNDGLTLLIGGFVYYGDAAVLQTHRDVYGVVINTKMHELDKLVAKYKEEPTDMVPVEIRGKIIPKPENEEGWPFRVEIEEILKVSKPTPESNDVIKLEQ